MSERRELSTSGSVQPTPTVYLSGPMTGYEGFNYPAFEAEAQRLRTLGYTVLSPHEQELDGEKTWENYMRVDLPMVCAADLIATLPGWTESRGAMLECFIGRQIGIPIVEASSLQEVAA